LKAALELLQRGKTLDRAQARTAMDRLLASDTPPEHVAAFLACLRMRGEAVSELSGFLDSIRARSIGIGAEISGAIDVCGSGGDGANTFNISTVSAFVLAGGGVRVAKHGNRAVSSACGSADVLRALGVAVEATPVQFRELVETTGFGFLFANHYHPHLAAVAGIRRSLGIRTTFNLLGPMLNPARVSRQVVGVFDPALCERIALTLLEQGSEEALVVSGPGGLDEFALSGETTVAHLKAGVVTVSLVAPESVGLARAELSEIRGGTVSENARILEAILSGERRGAALDIVLYNAGAGFFVAGRARSIREGVELARESVRSGAARQALENVRNVSDAIVSRA
jgi:anthranilate phosphoribosyltransferase